jgi:hypothetical protein
VSEVRQGVVQETSLLFLFVCFSFLFGGTGWLSLLGRHSVTQATPPALFALVILLILLPAPPT